MIKNDTFGVPYSGTEDILLKRYFDPKDDAEWKHVLNFFLQPVGGPYLLTCNFDPSSLKIAITQFYNECLTLWSKLNGSMPEKSDEILNEIIWNNKYICINNKSCFISELRDAGINKISNMIKMDGTCRFLIRNDLQNKGLKMKNFLLCQGLIDAILIKWKQAIKTMTCPYILNSDSNESTVTINSVKVPTSKVNVKKLYRSLVSRVCEKPTAQRKFDEMFPDPSVIGVKYTASLSTLP